MIFENGDKIITCQEDASIITEIKNMLDKNALNSKVSNTYAIVCKITNIKYEMDNDHADDPADDARRSEQERDEVQKRDERRHHRDDTDDEGGESRPVLVARRRRR